MKAYTEKLHEELLSKLDELDKNYDPQNLSDPRLGMITATIDQIKEKLKTHTFSSIADEVYFFKSVLPSTLALHIYYRDKMEWDRLVRQGPPKCRFRFLDRVCSRIEAFRKDNRLFCDYYRDGQTDLDNFFFLRNSPINRESEYQLTNIIDPSSPPLHCKKMAELIAYVKLEFELKQGEAEIERIVSSKNAGKFRLRWTGKQIDMIELVYSLKETGSFNDGKASLKDIFESFRYAFEVDLGNTSRLFQDIVGRKTGYTIYLDLMRERLRHRIDDILK